MGLIVERIPHKDVSFAYLQIEAETANEFEKLRAEALKRIPHYAFALQAPGKSAAVAGPEADRSARSYGPEVGPAEVAARESDAAEAEAGAAGDVRPDDAPTAPASAPTSQGLSPREKAKAKMAAARGA